MGIDFLEFSGVLGKHTTAPNMSQWKHDGSSANQTQPWLDFVVCQA
jgi:hypothetical protein